MDANELYVFDTITRRPLQLLHFVRMLAAPGNEEIACYFFDRIERANGGAGTIVPADPPTGRLEVRRPQMDPSNDPRYNSTPTPPWRS